MGLKQFYYNWKRKQDLKKIRAIYGEEGSIDHPPRFDTLVDSSKGIGDAVVLMSLFKVAYEQKRAISIRSSNVYIDWLKDFNPYYRKNSYGKEFFLKDRCNYNLGGGHIIQLYHKLYNFPVPEAKGIIVVPGRNVVKGRVGINLTTSDMPHTKGKDSFQLSVIQDFIDNSDYEFVEICKTDSGLKNVDKMIAERRITRVVEKLATCEYYIGLDSGLMHLAAALDIKSVILVGRPQVSELYLPVLSNVKDDHIRWLYPNNIHLHFDGENKFVKKLTVKNLEKSMKRKFYPYV
jgi:hypothetical protein